MPHFSNKQSLWVRSRGITLLEYAAFTGKGESENGNIIQENVIVNNDAFGAAFVLGRHE